VKNKRKREEIECIDSSRDYLFPLFGLFDVLTRAMVQKHFTGGLPSSANMVRTRWYSS